MKVLDLAPKNAEVLGRIAKFREVDLIRVQTGGTKYVQIAAWTKDGRYQTFILSLETEDAKKLAQTILDVAQENVEGGNN